ncbi:MAG: proprotein convertase P-domain-containing protein, partial [Candidatus Eisenbacteria bacterium]
YPGGNFGMTDASGHFQIDGLYTATYSAQATMDGWSVGQVTGIAVAEGYMTPGVMMMLYPVTEGETCESPALAIPDNTPAGVYDTFTMVDELDMTDVEIYLNLTHTYIGDLIVEVTSPEGTTVRLHSQTGSGSDNIIGWYDSELAVNGPGALADFAGESSAGEWEIWVSDNVGADTGVLNTWCVHVYGGGATDVPDESGVLPSRCVLKGVSPNPFNPTTEVSYGLPNSGHVALKVYDVTGRLVRTLVDGEKGAGYHTEMWDGRDDGGAEVASGVYFCRMESASFRDTAKMVLLK